MTPWVLRLIVANTAVFLLSMTVGGVMDSLVLVPALILQRPWSAITYMFLHGGLGHLFFNMLSLFFFGSRVEQRLGERRFLILYFASGIAGALLSAVFSPWSAIVGASGAVFGVMLAFAWFWPHDQILIWGIIPIEARWMVALMTGLALFGGFTGAQGGIAHFAHLGGFVGGWICLKAFGARSGMKQFRGRTAPVVSREPVESAMARWGRIRRENLHEVNRGELDRILDKISASGVASLTLGEREFLERFAAREQLS
ncbi:MAG TPA: rhomboid family intramembrane serine protease [Gemmatimonadales bacterium]